MGAPGEASPWTPWCSPRRAHGGILGALSMSEHRIGGFLLGFLFGIFFRAEKAGSPLLRWARLQTTHRKHVVSVVFLHFFHTAGRRIRQAFVSAPCAFASSPVGV